MQKLLLIITLFIFQNQCFSQVKIGIAVGGNLANFPGDNDIILSRGSNLNLTELTGGGNATLNTVENKSRITINLGIRAEYELSDQWAIQSGLFYSPQGDRIEGDATLTINVFGNTEERPVEYEAVTELEYIVLPLKGKYTFSDKFSAVFGPQVGYRLNGSKATTEGFFPLTNDPLDFEEDIDDRLKDIDFGGIGGLEYSINDQFGINAEHFLATTQLPIEDRKVHNSITTLRLFYNFN